MASVSSPHAQQHFIPAPRTIPATKLIPEAWHEAFFSGLSETGKFTWGDLQYALISGSRFLEAAKETFSFHDDFFTDDEAVARVLESIAAVGDTLVDVSG
jgi:hypothetical protein